MRLTRLRHLFPPLSTLFIVSSIFFVSPERTENYVTLPLTISNPKTEKATSELIVNQIPNNKYNLSEVYERPLFSATRRNPAPEEQKIEVPKTDFHKEPEVKVIKEPERKSPDIQFLGVMRSGDKYSVLLRNERTEKWYDIRDKILDWEIVNIENEIVTLRYKKQEISIPITR